MSVLIARWTKNLKWFYDVILFMLLVSLLERNDYGTRVKIKLA